MRRRLPFSNGIGGGGYLLFYAAATGRTHVVDYGLGIQAAISAPKIDCSEPATKLDARIPDEVQAELAARGHRLAVVEGTPGASPSAALIDHHTGRLHGGEDPFSEGVAVGYTTGDTADHGGAATER